MDIDIRTVEPGEFDTYMRVLESAFGRGPNETEIERNRKVAEFDRLLVACEGDVMVGAAAAASFRMSLPGGRSAPVAGVIGAGVLPTHRRRGINTQLMRHQLHDIRERGEAFAALFASEGGIYGRYGYGVATCEASIEIETSRAAYARAHQSSGTMRLVDRADALAQMQRIYELAAAARPGMIVTNAEWFELRMTQTEDENEPWFFAIHEPHEGDPDGFAVYQVKRDRTDALPRCELNVIEVHALDPRAEADIWRYVFDVDLVDLVRADMRPADEPLLLRLAEPRRLKLRLSDGLYLRLVDVEAALRSRGYAEPGEVVLEVADRFCPWNEGRFALSNRDGEASCERTEVQPDLSCSAEDLAAVFLGGTGWRDLARAGRGVELVAGSLSRADGMFACDSAPWAGSFNF